MTPANTDNRATNTARQVPPYSPIQTERPHNRRLSVCFLRQAVLTGLAIRGGFCNFARLNALQVTLFVIYMLLVTVMRFNKQLIIRN